MGFLTGMLSGPLPYVICVLSGLSMDLDLPFEMWFSIGEGLGGQVGVSRVCVCPI